MLPIATNGSRGEMSNRAKWAHSTRLKPKPDRARIPVSLAFLVLGSFMIFGAVEAMRAGTYIFPAFDIRFGTPAIGQTIGLLLVGAAFAGAGVIGLVSRR
jgi:hypothetical protein